MHLTTVLRSLALPCLALALLVNAEGHARLEKRRPKQSSLQKRYRPEVSADVQVQYAPSDPGEFVKWVKQFDSLEELHMSITTFVAEEGIQRPDNYMVNCIKPRDDATKALGDNTTFPAIFFASNYLPGWSDEDGYMLVMCQTVVFPKQSATATTDSVDKNKVNVLPDRAGDMMDRLKKQGFNVSTLFTGPIDDVLAKAAKLKTGGKGKPNSLKESKEVVKKGDKPDPQKDDDPNVSNGGEPGKGDDDDPKKGDTSHKHKKANKH